MDGTHFIRYSLSNANMHALNVQIVWEQESDNSE